MRSKRKNSRFFFIKLPKIGLSLSMSGGILFFILSYFFSGFYSAWSLGGKFQLAFLLYILVFGGAIVGAILGFLGKKFGYYLCVLTGISFPLLEWYLSGPYFFSTFFEGLINAFYLYFPWSLLFIGGITGFIEWRIELRKNNLIS